MAKTSPKATKKHRASSPKKRASRSAKVATEAGSATRQNTKQAKLIAMLRMPEGATIGQIAKAFGWQRHTVRGVLSGALKKKLGLIITSAKAEEGERVYRIA